MFIYLVCASGGGVVLDNHSCDVDRFVVNPARARNRVEPRGRKSCNLCLNDRIVLPDLAWSLGKSSMTWSMGGLQWGKSSRMWVMWRQDSTIHLAYRSLPS